MSAAFFVDLKKKQLKRNEELVYTLDDESIDRFFGLQDSYFVLTPEKLQVVNFAVATYLFGLFGINVSSFTSIPAGYIASYEKGENFFGTFIIDPYYIENTIVELCDNKIKNDDHSDFYTKIKEIIRDPKVSFLEKSMMISDYIKSNGIDYINLSDSLKRFSTINDENCDNNHKLLCKTIASDESLLEDLIAIKDADELNKDEEANLSDDWKEKIKKEKLVEAIAKQASLKSFDNEEERERFVQELLEYKQSYNAILNEFILPGYLTYRGTDRNNNPINQDSLILNKKARVEELINKYLGSNYSSSDIVHIFNMCSTDYSADMVKGVFEKIISYKKSARTIDEDSKIILSGIPATPDDIHESINDKNQIRNSFRL